jgi:hypothetical protein
VERQAWGADNVNVGLLFRLEAKPGAADDVARLLEAELSEAFKDLPITAWHWDSQSLRRDRHRAQRRALGFQD